jgi:sugar/nucleoside kinase (ribokinase family)
MLDCLCAGLAVADHLCIPIPRMPHAGELLLTDRLELQTGGHAANVSTDLAKLGVKVGISARIGQDLFGRFVRERLTQSGVRTETLVETPGVDTSGTLIVNIQGQDRRFIHAIGANGEFDGSEVSEAQLRSIRVLYVGGLFALPKLTAVAVQRLFQKARGMGVATVLDLNGSERFRTRVFPVECIDGTGSGDAFAAGYILGMLEHASTIRCVELGTALGASCVRRTGASAGVFNRSELDEFLTANRLDYTQIN